MVKIYNGGGGGGDLSQDDFNPVMLEAFEWYLEPDQQHWQRLRLALPALEINRRQSVVASTWQQSKGRREQWVRYLRCL